MVSSILMAGFETLNPTRCQKLFMTYRTYIEGAPPEIAANALICLIHQSNFLLDQQLRQLEKQFLEQGGFTEKLYRTRQSARRRSWKTPWPTCESGFNYSIMRNR
jgi:four helix bundle suffix protein